jgi:hypothetical protein
LLAAALPGTILAHHFSHPVMASRDDMSLTPRPALAGPDTITLLAAMVQFQQDADVGTTGNGRFDLTAAYDSTLDAPPRNAEYFRDHLTFLEHYYSRVSRGKTVIRWTLIDSVFTLPNLMSAYSPPKDGPNTAVGNLARDTWSAVDASGLVPDFSRYRSFVVFHAGVGRDIDLVSIYGFDPTPRDIPSLYIGLKAFKEFYGSDYQGIPVNGGAAFVTNSIVVPETECRTVPGLTGDVYLELGTNGLLCASFGNFLGLPDLFDTRTGRSGIGRFGLMDGQAIFSFAGAFPPEPSAWEKQYLGWINPIALPSGSSTIGLPAAGLGTVIPTSPDTVYRVTISPTEYFLVENRNRDPQQNGQVVHSSYRGTVRDQFWRRDTTGFNAFDISALAGVVTDVEDFDWSLPGGVDDAGTFYDGGALIWHIDDAIIARTIGTNSVNANPELRGVDVEEADGSQDIGQQYGSFTGGSGSEEGTALDFWYEGNGSPVFRNEFSALTFPNTNTNSGAVSHVSMRNFSPRGPHMTATVTRGDADVAPLPGFPRYLGETLADVSLTVAALMNDGRPDIIVATKPADSEFHQPGVRPSKIFAWSSSGGAVIPGQASSGLFAAGESPDETFMGAPSVADINGDAVPDVVVSGGRTGSNNGRLLAFSARNLDGDSLADPLFSVNLPRLLVGSPAIGDSLVAVGDNAGRAYFIRRTGTVADSVVPTYSGDQPVEGVSCLPGNRFVITRHDGSLTVAGPGTTRAFGHPVAGPAIAWAGAAPGGEWPSIRFSTRDGYMYSVDSTTLAPLASFPVTAGGVIAQPPALADVDGDGRKDLIVFADNRIEVFNDACARVANFPVTVRGTIASNPVVADVDGDGLVDIVAVTDEGLVVAYNRNGMPAAGFPLQAGKGKQSAAAFVVGDSVCLAVASQSDGSVSAWRTGKAMGGSAALLYPWAQYQQDQRHSGLDRSISTGTPLSNEFLPKERAYNWPNPVYNGKTFIRYFVRESAAIKISIFDLAGDLVSEFNRPATGGMDEEMEWDATGVQSGVYFARIEATNAGSTGTTIIKIAVVR